MKTTKRTFTMTALSLLLCFCMVFGLAGCGASQEDIDNAVNEATAPLNEQIAQLNEDIAVKEAEITTLEGEKATLVAEKTELEANVAALETEKATLMSAKAELETDIATLETEKSTLSTRVTELETQVQTLTNRVAELESSGSDNDSVIAQLRADIATLQSEKSTLSSRVTELEGTITSKNSEIATLNSSISTLESEKSTLSARITTLEASITEKDAEIANLNSTISTLRSEKETLTNKVAELESENTELKDKVEALENCIKGNHVAGTYSKTETTHTYTCTVCGTEITEEHEYVELVCVCGAEIEESNVTDMKNTLYNGNTYTLQNDLTLSENASVAATGKTPVLNLNGKTIFTNNYLFNWLSGDLTINGSGAFVGNHANGGILDVQGTNATLRLVGDITFTNTAEDGYHITWHSSMLDLSDYTGNALMIKNISSFAQETFTIILPDGWKLYHGDGTAFAESETIAANEIVTADLDVEAKWGTSVDDLTNGGSLAEALASNAVYIQLRQNVTLTDRIEVAEGVTLTFDFNGYTVTAGSNKDGFYNNGTLTLLNGKILDNNASYCSVTNKGTLTMTDVVINGGNPLKQTQGTATLTRCALTQIEDSFYYNAIYAEGGTIVVTDSSFSADRDAIWVKNTDLTLKGTVSLTYGTTTQNCGILLYYGDLDLSLVTSGLNGVDVTVGGSTAEPTTVMLPDGYEAKDEYSGDTVDLSGSITSSMIVELVSAS